MIKSRKADKIYIGLLKAIKENGGVECEEYPDIYIAPDNIEAATIQSDYKFTRIICGRCPLKDMCADYAVESRQTHGMWGGLTPREIGTEFLRRYNYVAIRGRPRSDFALIAYGDEEGPAKESRSESDFGPLHLSSSESTEWGEGDSEQVLAWGEDWDSDSPLY